MVKKTSSVSVSEVEKMKKVAQTQFIESVW